ncbi:MAG TPA: PPC domain-containing protein [Gemmatimonadales bacterium]|nr:PPC domain-containing protein [Gemmatimonadales bacterium]
MRAVFMLSALTTVVAPALVAQVPIRVGQVVTGRLTQTDQKFSDGSRYKLYAFVGNKGDTLTADLSSDDFDANLLIADAAGNSLARNDDGGGQCNARLMFVPPATGNYRLYANSSAQAELGDYKLTLSRGREAAPADTVCKGFGRVAGLIEVGQTITGNLTSDDPEFSGDSTYFERWILPVRANQAFTVDLISDDFDAYLLLTKGRGDKLVDNDDGGGGCNARLVYTATDDHPLRVIVNTASRPRRQTGRFTLRVTEGQSNVETKGNCRFTNNLASNTQTLQQVSNVSTQSTGGSQGIQTIRVGETINGELTSSDSLYPDTTYFKMYQFTAIPGQPITIDLAADEFDPLLIIRGDDLDRSIIDDDGGPGCYSRVSRVFPSAGPYRILVNTTSTPKRQTGHFSLSITQGSKPVQEGSAASADCRSQSAPSTAGGSGGGSAHSIDVGQTQQGELTASDVLLTHDSTYAQPWTIHGVAGQTITIDLESDAFDAYLFLRGPGIAGGRDFQDDDSGGNCNARLTATFPQTGDYEIDVNTVGHYATGAFTLSVTSGSKPKSVARCSRSNQ